MTTYTVINRSSGEPEGRRLSATDAADIVLSHDGHEYEVRREETKHGLSDGTSAWQLYVSRGSRNSYGGNRGFTECYVYGSKLARSYAATEETAWAEIAEQVCKGCGEWGGAPDIMTDESYTRMLAEVE